MTPETLTLAERIRIARSRAGLKQEELADALGVSRPLVSKWERGESKPDLNQKIKLARLLTQPLDIFCTEDDLVDLRTALDVGIRGANTGSEQDGLWSGWTTASESDDLFPASIDARVSHRAQELCAV